jgi:hypothetical protein
MQSRSIPIGFMCLALAVAVATSPQAMGSVEPFEQSAIAAPRVQIPSSATSPALDPRAVLDRYCVTCHNTRAKTAQLSLDKMDLAHVAADAETWERVVRKLQGGLMPPAGRPRPSQAILTELSAWLEGELDRAAAERPNAGRTEALHRLNRTEYRRTIRDLLDLDMEMDTLLPADDAGGEFDNMAGVLKLNQSVLERYLTAARVISRLAVGSSPSVPVSDTFRLSDEALQYHHVEGLPFGTRGGSLLRYNFPQDGEYSVVVTFLGSKVEAAGYDASTGFVDEHQLEISIDGERVHLATIAPKALRRLDGSQDPAVRIRLRVKAGPREVGVAFVKLPSTEEVDGARRRPLKPQFQSFMVPPNLAVYQPYVDSVTISGPFGSTRTGDTPSRRRIFTCGGDAASPGTGCARNILSTLARRAFRRPVSKSDVDDLMKYYERGRAEEGGGFENGIEVALARILTSVDFLFRVEVDPPAKTATPAPTAAKAPAAAAASANYRIDELAMASRLSFFLWSSIPDDELLNVAARGRLKDPAVLEQQVRRMLADPRADALVESFAVQWLQLRTLNLREPDALLFPDFDDSLREAFYRETVLFVGSVFDEDRSVLDLLRANYTFLNERLATHYGIPGVKGSRFRRVLLPDTSPRIGLLGQGSILTITSMANRTSPVSRGKWVLESILGTPPPDPPADVPSLEEAKPGLVPASMREQMAQHRSNAVCASCHSMIDPPGFALENFDAVGRFRRTDEGARPIDPAGTLPDGSKFTDIASFRAELLRHPERFVTMFAEKLLTYALGRSLESPDQPAVRKIVRDAAGRGHSLSSLVLGVTKSLPFQMRRMTHENQHQ